MSDQTGVPEALTSWCEVDAGALRANVAALHAALRPPAIARTNDSISPKSPPPCPPGMEASGLRVSTTSV